MYCSVGTHKVNEDGVGAGSSSTASVGQPELCHVVDVGGGLRIFAAGEHSETRKCPPPPPQRQQGNKKKTGKYPRKTNQSQAICVLEQNHGCTVRYSTIRYSSALQCSTKLHAETIYLVHNSVATKTPVTIQTIWWIRHELVAFCLVTPSLVYSKERRQAMQQQKEILKKWFRAMEAMPRR